MRLCSRQAFVHVAADEFTIKQLSLGMLCHHRDAFFWSGKSQSRPLATEFTDQISPWN